ncbi:MAG: proton-conducting transporter membrane subunit [Hyphomicrobiaceae bacterium]
MTATDINPALLMILAGALCAVLPRAPRQFVALATPAVGIAALLAMPMGTVSVAKLGGLTLTLMRLDGLAFPFTLIFLIAALLNAIYALHQDDRLQDCMAMIYGGAAIRAVLAGDLVTLFVYWELTAISSVFLIVASHTDRAYRAAMRYLVWQIGSGVLLVAGILLHYRATGALVFGPMKLEGAAAWLIFIAFGIKCAFPLLHNWLQDAYPEATVTGSVVLSAFTTKLAVYAFARVFAGDLCSFRSAR